MNAKMMREFKKPGSKYRGAPFWAWNGKLEPDELRRQIRLMHKMGLGGFFMHSRVGLDTEYLSDEWFACVDACIDEAEKLDMQAWLYDEDRWPSGAAGGKVTKNPAYRARTLMLEELDSLKGFKPGKDTVAVFTARVDGSSAVNVKRTGNKGPAKLARGEKLLHYYVHYGECSSWFNGYAYLDTLNHEAVAEFIKVTHEEYRKRVGKHFGKRIPGIFTDEPNYLPVAHTAPDTGEQVPWTGSLPATFKKRYGYDLIDRLPEILFDVDGNAVSQARYHYMDCVTFLFCDAFARQIGEWCAKNGMRHTGHVLSEDVLSGLINRVGSTMRFYEHMQAPGMDLLTEHWRVYDTAKAVSSVANQCGRTWRLTETYGCTGWDFSFAGHKALGDWQAALGINLRAQHLSWYTMEGEAKRDYPAGIFYQSPWWEHYAKVEDYFGRVNAVMTAGREVRDLLVIHPNESMWTLVKKEYWRADRTFAYDRILIDLRDALLGRHVDFDYGDEEMLGRLGSVTTKDGVRLRFGKASYSTVLVPPLVTVRSTTVALLEKFSKVGGTVVFSGTVPAYVDALPSDAPVRLAATCRTVRGHGTAMAEACAETARRISITGPDGEELATVLYLLRETPDAWNLFVCNTGHSDRQLKRHVMNDVMVRDRTRAYPVVRISGLRGKGTPVELDPDDGNAYTVNARRTDGTWTVTTSLPALGSRIFTVPKNKTAVAAVKRFAGGTVKRRALNPKAWDVSRSDDNVLLLDRARYRIDSGAWRKTTDILAVDADVRKALGTAPRGGQMVQPWARPKKTHEKTVAVTLEYAFDADALPAGAVRLAVEQPRSFSIELNGEPVCTEDTGWWCDLSLRTLPLQAGCLKKGRNVLTLTCAAYGESHPGFEYAYLLGDFGVKQDKDVMTLITAPDTLKTGDWVKQGLPFYGGNLAYRKTVNIAHTPGERVFLSLPDYRGTAIRVLVDGVSAGTVAWEPNEVDLTDLLPKNGKMNLAIEVLGHRRNSHGPFHFPEKWPNWTGPAQFPVKPGYELKYQLVPCGLMKPPVLEWRK